MVGRMRPATAGSFSSLCFFSTLVKGEIGVKEGKTSNSDIELKGALLD